MKIKFVMYREYFVFVLRVLYVFCIFILIIYKVKGFIVLILYSVVLYFFFYCFMLRIMLI